MSKRATLFIGMTAAAGASVFAYALAHWQNTELERFVCYLIIAVLASSLKIQIPGLDGTMSVNFLFILLGVLELSLPETLLIGCTAALVQSFWQARQKIVATKVVFNVFMMANAIALSFFTYHQLAGFVGERTPVLLAITALVFFLANTLPVAIIISLTEGKSARKVWSDCHFWSFPYYLVGAAVVFTVGFVNRYAGWQTALLVLLPIYWVYRSYRLYLGKLEAEKNLVQVQKQQVEDVASLHLRTIEALALAIEAKDHTAQEHLQRLRLFTVSIAQELGLPEPEIEALRAAALLHDIGKLAVPEHIINKPGKLTPEEFEKVKIHPIVGADILERVAFPYPVAPIVRAHHEKWDGSGYPDGLKGEQIPMGARILAAVDSLDALVSDGQQRNALPLAHAMERISARSGTSFDPKVIEVLKRHYVDLEKMVQALPQNTARGASCKIQTGNQSAPATGFEETSGGIGGDSNFLASIAAARQEAQTMFELSQDLGNSLSLGETLSVLSMRLRRLIPYDSMVVFLNKSGVLVPELVSGDNFRILSSLNLRVGEGLCGWVAEQRKPILNGNPQMETGYVQEHGKYTTLRSALAVPLEGMNGVVGVLAMYRADQDAFTPDHLRILLGVTPKIALSVENALKYAQAENSATTDYLTGLPNARSLFVHLARELARCRRTGTALAVMVCDLDNFKQINDLYGHLEGDNLLRDFAGQLQDLCRGYDYVARMGGDEFVIVAPGMKPAAAEEKAHRLNQLAVSAGKKIAGRNMIGLSVGTSFCPEDGFDLEQLLGAADRRMYSVKQIHHEELERETQPPDSNARSATVN
ncbi:MAG: diguanylate cyclase [Acidobacteria bacterium]|nr:diguanylate cyclase [Acidobacteriota bacterium]